MKKTLFTLCSIALVCCAIIMSCTKNDDTTIKHVGYAGQSGYGTGNNPNPNGLPYVTPTVTPTNTNTPPPATVYSVTLTTSTGPITGTMSSPSCGGTSMSAVCSNSQIGTVSLSFASAPVAGNSYTVTSTLPSSGQVIVSYNGNYASSGTVAITSVGGYNVATFNGVTGTSPTTYTLSGGFSCQ